MANEWNTSYPVDHTKIGDVPGEIRKLKDSVKDQISHEHEAPVDGDATGSEHSGGSAVAYEGTATPTNRPDGSTALANNAIDRGRLWLDDNFDPPLLKRWTGSAFEVVQNVTFSAYTNEDDASDTLIKDHAYLANSSGFVIAYCQADASEYLRGYVGDTDNPAGAGVLVQSAEGESTTVICIFFAVGAGQYFEVTISAGTTGNAIRWQSVGTLQKPTDQD